MRIVKQNILLFLLFVALMSARLNAQVAIVSIGVQPFNIVPQAMLHAGINNMEGEQQVRLAVQIVDASNTVVFSVKSEPFTLYKGLNTFSTSRRVALVEYASSTQGTYLKTTHNLPSGRFKVCASINSLSGADKLDDFCEELEAEFSQYLYLVNPLDGDTVETKTPILSWTHSEPFTILNQGEYYRMIVTNMTTGQTAEEAVNVNSPTMMKNYLKDHQFQYPYDAKELKSGNKYAWQVQKISDGVIVNKTEAWQFVVRNIQEKKSLKYVALRPEQDGAFYTAYNGMVYFKFNEEYKSNGKLKFKLYDLKGTSIDIGINQDNEQDRSKDNTAKIPAQLKYSGDNRFELDLDSKSLNSGFYNLEVKNEKKETYFLKIFLP